MGEVYDMQYIVASSDALLCSMNHDAVSDDGQFHIMNHGIVGDRPKASLLSCHSHWQHSSGLSTLLSLILVMALLKHDLDGRCRERAVFKEA